MAHTKRGACKVLTTNRGSAERRMCLLSCRRRGQSMYGSSNINPTSKPKKLQRRGEPIDRVSSKIPGSTTIVSTEMSLHVSHTGLVFSTVRQADIYVAGENLIRSRQKQSLSMSKSVAVPHHFLYGNLDCTVEDLEVQHRSRLFAQSSCYPVAA